MNRLLSILLSITDDLIPLFRPSNSSGFISLVFLIAANSVPVIGVIFLNWNPYMILFIYWGESVVAGFFNILKMLISGAIENGKISTQGLKQGIGLSLFFTIHYGMFMIIHLVFLAVFMFLTITMKSKSTGSAADYLAPFISFFPASASLSDIADSEFSAVIAIFISYTVSFFLYFIKTAEYSRTNAADYLMRPYRRIVVMHLTIIFGAFFLFISGFKSGIFVAVWIGIKIFADLKMHVKEIGSSFQVLNSRISPDNVAVTTQTQK